jgi:hypothetical protein
LPFIAIIMKRKEHPDSDEDGGDDSSSQTEKKRKMDLVRHGLASMLRKQTNCVPLPEYKQVRKQLSAKFQNRGLGSAWMSILDAFCQFTPAESVMVLGRRFYRSITKDPTATWPDCFYADFKRLAVQIDRTRHTDNLMILFRGIYARGSGLTTSLVSFTNAVHNVFPGLLECMCVREASGELEFLSEMILDLWTTDKMAKDRRATFRHINRIIDSDMRAKSPPLDSNQLLFVVIRVPNGGNELVITQAKFLNIMGVSESVPRTELISGVLNQSE